MQLNHTSLPAPLSLFAPGLLRLIVTQAAGLIFFAGALGIGSALLLIRLLASTLVWVTILADRVAVNLERQFDIAVSKQNLHALWIGSDAKSFVQLSLLGS